MNKKLNFIFKNKNIYKFFLYLLVIFVIIFSTYFFIPNFFNYTPKLIQESLKKNSNINIKNIANINYKFFPSPRLRLSRSNIEFEENILEVEGAEVDIILNPLNILDYKNLDYNKFLIIGGSTKIEINKVSKLFSYIKDNQKKINFKKNTFIFLKDNNKLFEVNDSVSKINNKNNTQKLNLNGLFLNHNVSFILENKFGDKTRIKLKIPKLDISTNILLKKKNSFKNFTGLVNFEILNNFFQFNLIKKKNIIINKGFVRSDLINSSFEGNLSLNPYFLFTLDLTPSSLKIEKIVYILQNKFFSSSTQDLEIIKKINGSLNFKNIINGSIVFKNNEIIFKNFKVDEDDPILFDAKLSKFEKGGILDFNLNTKIQDRKNFSKDINISGFVVISSSKVTFKEIIIDKQVIAEKKIKYYEEEFKNKIINESLTNIFDKKRIKNYLQNFLK